MTDFGQADHAMGLELQLEELNEQRERARVQNRPDDVHRLDAEIAGLQDELATTAEALAFPDAQHDEEPRLHHGEELGADG